MVKFFVSANRPRLPTQVLDRLLVYTLSETRFGYAFPTLEDSMAILQKEALEYQRALFELPRMLFTGLTIFTTAASFLVRSKLDHPPTNYYAAGAFVLGIFFTFVAFVFAYSVVAHTVYAMKISNSNDEAEQQVDSILNGVYRKFSWSGSFTLVYWLGFIIFVVVW